ncbi:MAG: isochorismatase family protein [Candidatus Niyogibacteria bacterium]|nr:MAG: isochorismatase family protein [Candidatus Niyogibacteria bacterium]
MRVHLLIIDPQKDFMDDPDSSLPVPGANADMNRLAEMIRRIGHKLEDIHVTLDSHGVIDVGHPGFWVNSRGEHPAHYTIIKSDDIRNGIWTPFSPSLRKRMIDYAETLEKNQGKYSLMVWPEHCEIGTPGHNVQKELAVALADWSRRFHANVDYVVKGTNPFTEHYGALMAEVPDPSDPATGLNTALLDILAEVDVVAIAGEAFSHCVKSTVTQIAENLGEEYARKFHILTDCSSPVPKVGNGPDFPAITEVWLKEMEKRGMVLTTSKKFLA